MNMRDSEAMAGMLAERNYEITDHESKADIILFNTCSAPVSCSLYPFSGSLGTTVPSKSIRKIAIITNHLLIYIIPFLT